MLEHLKNLSTPDLIDPRLLFESLVLNGTDRQNVINSEIKRIKQRDGVILETEMDFLRKQEIKVPDFSSLSDYCYWLSPTKVNIVRWDLLRHYSSHLQGDTTYPDLSYHSVFTKNGEQPVSKVHKQDFPGHLVTHSIHIKYLSNALDTRFLYHRPQVSLSSGQIVFSGDAISGTFSLAFIFDRRDLEKVYTILPYTDHEVEWEREIRAYEPVSLKLTLGCLPISSIITNDFQHWGQSTCVCGQNTIAQMENNYLKNGKLWNENFVSLNF